MPPNPKVGFDGIVVRCQVLEREPPSRLAYSWSAGPIIDTHGIYRLEPDGDGTRVFFEHSGFDMSQPWGEQAFRGVEVGWETPVCCSTLIGGTLTVLLRLNKVLDPKIVDRPAVWFRHHHPQLQLIQLGAVGGKTHHDTPRL